VIAVTVPPLAQPDPQELTATIDLAKAIE